MASPNFGIDYLLGKVWCNPGVDNQYIVAPARITPDGGLFGQFTYARELISLPSTDRAYQVFSVGQFPPSFLSLIDTKAGWVKFSDIQTEQNLIVDVYTAKGLLMHKDNLYFMLTQTQDILFAVGRGEKGIVDFNEKSLYFRIYKNHFYTLERRKGVVATSVNVATFDDIPAFQSRLLAYKQLGYGHAYVVKNNLMYANIHPFNTSVGDDLDMVFDESIIRIVDFKTNATPVFDSTLDNAKKFLLHYPALGDDRVYYQDDVDVYVGYKNDRGDMVGFYIPKNIPSIFRQVTHRDYSLSQPIVNSLVQANGWADGREIFIRLHIRDGGMNLRLVNTKEKLRELYKLDETALVGALTGINAALPFWNASYLEKSGYANFVGKQILAGSGQLCTKEDVANVLGYTPMAKLLNDLPVKTDTQINNGRVLRTCDAPLGSQDKSVAICYDNNGAFLGTENHVNSSVHYFTSPAVGLVEFIPGTPSDEIDEVYQANNVVLNPELDYRFYACGKYNGIPDKKWRDVTGTSAYQVINNIVIWNLDFDLNYVMVRSNANVLVNNFTADNKGGYVGFTLVQNTRRSGTLKTEALEIPLGELAVYMNNALLIQGIDYVVNFPEVVIISKKFLKNPSTVMQTGTYVMTGHCKSDLSWPVVRDAGFVYQGVLSKNHQYNIRDDKVLRINVGGALKTMADVKMDETTGATRPFTPMDGTPYEIRDVVIPVKKYLDKDTYAMRDSDIAMDTQMANYITQHVPDSANTPDIINGLYLLYSPFASRILGELTNNNISTAAISNLGAASDVIPICKPYEYLLAFDPTQDGLTPDDRYCLIHPWYDSQVVRLDVAQYIFFKKVVDFYLKGKVEINNFVMLR